MGHDDRAGGGPWVRVGATVGVLLGGAKEEGQVDDGDGGTAVIGLVGEGTQNCAGDGVEIQFAGDEAERRPSGKHKEEGGESGREIAEGVFGGEGN